MRMPNLAISLHSRSLGGSTGLLGDRDQAKPAGLKD